MLGDGQQRKSYLYVQDCLDAILFALERADKKINIFNLGTDEYCTVNESIASITSFWGSTPSVLFLVANEDGLEITHSSF